MSESARLIAQLGVEEWTIVPGLLPWLIGLATAAAFWIWDRKQQ